MENIELKDISEKLEKLEKAIEKDTVAVPTPTPVVEKKESNKIRKTLKDLYEGKLKSAMVGKATNVEGTDNLGGYLVPEEFGNFIFDPNQYGLVRKYGTVIPMNRDKLNLPYVSTDLVAYNPGEATAGTASNYVFGNLELNTNTYIGLAPCSKEFVQDSLYPVENIVANSLAIQFAGAEDTLFYNQIKALPNANTLTASATGTFTASYTAAEIFAQMIGTLEAINTTYSEGAVFIFHPTVYQAVCSWKDGEGRHLVDMTAPVPSLFGYPIIKSNKFLSTSLTSGGEISAVFGNLKNAYLGDRMGIEVQASDVAVVSTANAFTDNLVTFKGTERVDVKVDPRAFVALEMKS